jgi:3-phenylpropionate/cinnamic acid dioxygenase small subunit
MSEVAAKPIEVRDFRLFELKSQIEELFYKEAELLDQRRFTEWLELLAEDIVYFMPMVRNVKFGEHAAHEFTREEKDISWFNEGKWTLAKRVEQILTGVHWAEEPLSRTTHMISNIQLMDIRPSLDQLQEIAVRSTFLVNQCRVEYEQNTFVGKRIDTLRRVDNGWQFARREIQIDQNVLLAKNLTTFF